MTAIQSFTGLKAWQEGHRLVLSIYSITKKFPRDEQYALTSQMQRAVVSITSNISEGFSRMSKKEKSQFYSIALGSLTELQNQLLIARDLGYTERDTCQNIAQQTVIVSKLINGLRKSVQDRTT